MEGPDDWRIQGNNHFKAGNYLAALESYTKAINLNPKDCTLYSNRSLVHLKMKNYYYSNKDADMAIELNKTWPKAHYRKAEVLTEIGQYEAALLSYGRALALKPDDYTLLAAAQKAAKFSGEQMQYEKRIPWVGAGIGIIIGVLISLFDHLFTKEPAVKHPALMVLSVMIISIIGYILAKTYLYYQRVRKKYFMEPNEISEDEMKDEKDVEFEGHSNRSRYTKAQARLRYKKGKF
ncbi:serine/threonine-protein phosphatase 5-like [Condylostylus longicornis]|uniref:serine/threonine-protein phosphatase 5-like n=1 Tax=Condylostylus longicornis TaxID=2530218 RepID=UPI00244E0DB3|nr:serine/threonine-protein phosphatase 5-like [Condylostylus longicornis]